MRPLPEPMPGDSTGSFYLGSATVSATPYMKLYIGDYLGDTQHLSALQHGAYLLLIMAYWQRKGPLPAEDDKLARIARCTDAEWMQCKSDALAFFEERDGLLYHNRIEKELAEVGKVSSKRKSAAETKWSKSGKSIDIECISNANAEQMDNKSNANDMLSHIHSHSYIQIEENKREESFLPPLQSKPISRDGSARIELARAYWNTKAPAIGPPCMMLAITFRPEDTSDCLRVMNAYDDELIFQAIDNYADIRASSEHEVGSPYRSFVGFIRGGVEKFVSDAKPFEAFKKREAPDWIKDRDERQTRGTLDGRPDAWDGADLDAHLADAAEAMSPEEKAKAMDEWAKEHPDSPVAKALARMTG